MICYHPLGNTGGNTGGNTSNCKDNNSSCRSWARYCNSSSYGAYMKKTCKKTCGKCGGMYDHAVLIYVFTFKDVSIISYR